MGCISSKRTINAIQPNPVPRIPSSNNLVPESSQKNIYIITDNINKYYDLKQNLGSGHFGVVKLGVSKLGNKQKVAIKSVIKERVKEELKNLQRELTILKTVDHPNIIKLFEVFEDDKHLHIVMEYCPGGELYDRLEKKGKFSEKESASLMRKLFHAVNHLHVMNISHRDLKPENCLFDSKKEDAEIKIVDFGLATRFTREKGMSSIVGTPYYVAPEIINGHYGPECDIWSLGVILHTMLVGYPPFRGENRNDIFKKVLKGKYSLKEKEFETVSNEAKEMIRKLLMRDADKRITALQAMEDPWFKMILPIEPERQIDESVMRRLRAFKSSSRLQNEILKVIVTFLTETELKQLISAFRKLDKDYSGYICTNELGVGFDRVGLRVETVEMNALMSEVDFDRNGKMNYTEFLAVALDEKVFLKHENVWAAFKRFDIDDQGFITKDNLKKCIEKTGVVVSDSEMNDIIRELSLKNPNLIDFKDFCGVLDRIL